MTANRFIANLNAAGVTLRVRRKTLYTQGYIPRWARQTIENHADELVTAITTKADLTLRVIPGTCEFFGPNTVSMSRGYTGRPPLELAYRMLMADDAEQPDRDDVPDQIKRMSVGNLRKWKP